MLVLIILVKKNVTTYVAHGLHGLDTDYKGFRFKKGFLICKNS
jgi:hypothetical protein